MTQPQKLFLFLLRISLGFLFLYAGFTKVIDPGWSAAGYLKGAVTFSGFYQWLASSQILPFTNFLNEWGLTLIGVALILGVFVRLSAMLGAIIMILYYFPILDFPLVGEHGYIVDEHIIYATVLLLLGSLQAGRVWGLEKWCSSFPI
ncbi:MAG: DoxX family protein [Patescibacteria group bacterium]